jgi:hypothetical protein
MRRLVALLIAGICANSSSAGEVFTWTDDEGVVHYSQWAPKDTTTVTTLKTISRNPADYDPGADPYSIQNQAARVNKTWSKIEERNAELRKRRQEEEERLARMQPPVYQYPYDPYSYYRAPVWRPIYRPVHPIYPVHPVQPIYPGPVRPHQPNIHARQIAAMSVLNRRPSYRRPYSSVTGVSQRATIHRSMPGN